MIKSQPKFAATSIDLQPKCIQAFYKTILKQYRVGFFFTANHSTANKNMLIAQEIYTVLGRIIQYMRWRGGVILN